MDAISRAFAVADQLRGVPEVKESRKCDCQVPYVHADKVALVCPCCGACDENFVSDEPEWRNCGDDGDGADQSRVGAPRTHLFSEAWEMNTKMLAPKHASRETKTLCKIAHHQSMNYTDATLCKEYKMIDEICARLGIAEHVITVAKHKWQQYYRRGPIKRGNPRKAIKAACVLQACKEANCIRSSVDVARAFEIPLKCIGEADKDYKKIVPDLALKYSTPASVVPGLVSGLPAGLVPDSERGRLIRRVANKCDEIGEHPTMMGKTPMAVAAATTLLIMRELGYETESLLQVMQDMSGRNAGTIVKIIEIIKAL
jgi:transcription initiation factor TFIIIB Brf1 subunit/transcription initiation factor TFIIB